MAARTERRPGAREVAPFGRTEVAPFGRTGLAPFDRTQPAFSADSRWLRLAELRVALIPRAVTLFAKRPARGPEMRSCEL